MDIFFTFIGKFDLPSEKYEPTPEELAKQEKQRQKRAKQREYNRRWYARQREEYANQQADKLLAQQSVQ